MADKTESECPTENMEQQGQATVDESYAAAAGALGLEKGGAQASEAIEALEAQLAEQKDKVLRAMAEMENARRIAKRDISNAHKYALTNIVQELLAVVDSFEQGLAAAEGNEGADALRQGMELTHRMLLDVLAKFNVEQLDPLGQVFNPEQHEAMSIQETDEQAPNTILVVVQKGYRLHDRVIRPARVVVAKEKSSGG